MTERILAKRKMADCVRNHVTESYPSIPSKRTPPSPSDEDGRRQVLRQSFEKLRRLDDPERCLLRSVLLHNTARRMQTELLETAAPSWPCMLNADNEHNPCIFRHLMAFRREQEDDFVCDDLSRALEKVIGDDEAPTSPPPLSQVPVWNFGAHAATVTGAPLVAGSITMGTPVAKETKHVLPTPAEMDMESLRTELLSESLSVEINNNRPINEMTAVPKSSQCTPTASQCRRPNELVNSATTLANFSQDLELLMTDYLSSCSPRTSNSLSCIYLNGDQQQTTKSLVAVP